MRACPMLILTFCALSACAPGAPPTPDELGESYYARTMDRLTAAGDSVLAAEAVLPIALYVLDGGGTAYPAGAPATGGGSGSATGTHAVELVSGGQCEGQRLLLHPMPGRAEVGDGFSPVLLVEGWAPPDETSVAVGAGSCPAVIGAPAGLTRDSLAALVRGVVAGRVVPALERERGVELEARVVGGTLWAFSGLPAQAWVRVALRPAGGDRDDQVALVGLRARAEGGWEVVHRSHASKPDPAVNAVWTPEPVAALDLDGDGGPEIVAKGSYPSMGAGAFNAMVIYREDADGTYVVWRAAPLRPIVH